MVLGKFPVPGRPTIWMTVGQGPVVLAVRRDWRLNVVIIADLGQRQKSAFSILSHNLGRSSGHHK